MSENEGIGATGPGDAEQRSLGEFSAEIQGNDTLARLSRVAGTYRKMTVDDLYGNDHSNKHGASLAAQERFLQAYEQARENNPQAVSEALALAPEALPAHYQVAGTLANQGKVKDALLLLQVQQEFNCTRAQADAILDQQEKAIAHRRSELENASRLAQTAIVAAAKLRDSNSVIGAFSQYEAAMQDFNSWNNELGKLMVSNILAIKTHSLEGLTLSDEDAGQLNSVMENWRTTLAQRASEMAPDLKRDEQSSERAFPILSTSGAGAQEMLGMGFTAYLSDHKDLSILRTNTSGSYISLETLKAEALLVSASENETLKVQVRVEGVSWGIDLNQDEQGIWHVTGGGEVDYGKPLPGGNWHDGYQYGSKPLSEEAISEHLSHYPGIVAAMRPKNN